MMNRATLCVGLVVLVGQVARAEDAPPVLDTLKFDGSVDVFYGYRLGTKDASAPTLFRAYDADNASFIMNYAKVGLLATKGPVGVRLDLGFGNVAEVNRQLVTPTVVDDVTRVLHQAYGIIELGSGGARLEAGKFTSWSSNEMVESYLNPVYSRSLQYNYGPFTHTGARVAVPLSNTLTLKAAVINGWDMAHAFTGIPTLGAALVWARPASTNITLLTYQGIQRNQAWRQYYDLVATHPFSDRFDAALEASFGLEAGKAWFGAALTGNYKFTPALRLALRAEHFNDKDAMRLPVPAALTDTTLCFGWAFGGHAELRLEARSDFADRPVFEAGTSTMQHTLSVAALAWF